MILRLLNPQGIAGLAATICLGLLLLTQKAETHHWKKQSVQFEQLYHADQAAFAQTIAGYRAAADAARAADRAAGERARAEQAAINERTANDYETRLATARTRAGELLRDAGAPANFGRSGNSGSARFIRCPRRSCCNRPASWTSCPRRPHRNRTSHPARRADQMGPPAVRRGSQCRILRRQAVNPSFAQALRLISQAGGLA